MTLSIVIPAHNGMPWIADTVESIQKQSFSDWRLIIRDDGSSDGTRAWLATLSDQRITVVEAEGSGAAANWTSVVSLADQPFVKLVCQDDILLENCLSAQVAALVTNPHAVMVASRHQVIDSNGKVILGRHGLRGLVGNFEGPKALERSVSRGANLFGEPASVMFRREQLQASLPFDPDFPYLTDLDMYRKVLLRGNFVGLDGVHATFRLSTNSWSQVLAQSQAKEFLSWLDRARMSGDVRLGFIRTAVAKILIRMRTLARRIVVRRANRRASAHAGP